MHGEAPDPAFAAVDGRKDEGRPALTQGGREPQVEIVVLEVKARASDGQQPGAEVADRHPVEKVTR
jgi:hypothetical protein